MRFETDLRTWKGYHVEAIPDLTGDGVSDYIVIQTDQNSDCQKSRQSDVCRRGLPSGDVDWLRGYGGTNILLYAGRIENGKLEMGPGRKLYSTADPVKWYSEHQDLVPPAIALLDVKDFNNDGVMDISFWVLTGNYQRYTQVLLINNVDFAKEAVGK